MDGLGDLRAAIEVRTSAARAPSLARVVLIFSRVLSPPQRRIDELDSFYTAHVDDERSMLFDKQRLKLRKLLHEYDEAVRSMSAPAWPMSAQRNASPPGQARGNGLDLASIGESGTGVTTRQIREDSRLSLPELLSWFTQAGAIEMPEVNVPLVEKLFANVTRTNVDGRMSVRDLRQWYISYGKRALRSGVSSFHDEVVPAALVKKGAAEAEGRGAGAGRAAGKALYTWEGDASGLGASAASFDGGVPLPLPNHMLEFQLRLTGEEYAAFTAKRRGYEAELRYKERQTRGRATAAALARDRLLAGEGVAGSGGEGPAGPYAEPAGAASYGLRA